jgi:hypothetical protein
LFKSSSYINSFSSFLSSSSIILFSLSSLSCLFCISENGNKFIKRINLNYKEERNDKNINIIKDSISNNINNPMKFFINIFPFFLSSNFDISSCALNLFVNCSYGNNFIENFIYFIEHGFFEYLIPLLRNCLFILKDENVENNNNNNNNMYYDYFMKFKPLIKDIVNNNINKNPELSFEFSNSDDNKIITYSDNSTYSTFFENNLNSVFSETDYLINNKLDSNYLSNTENNRNNIILNKSKIYLILFLCFFHFQSTCSFILFYYLFIIIIYFVSIH